VDSGPEGVDSEDSGTQRGWIQGQRGWIQGQRGWNQRITQNAPSCLSCPGVQDDDDDNNNDVDNKTVWLTWAVSALFRGRF
jgi:hypothetical protein